MRRSLTAIAFAASTAVLLAACSGGPGDSPSASAPEPEPVPTVTVTATATPEPETAPDFGFTFFEQANVGDTFAEAGAALHMPVIGMDACPYYGAVWNTDAASTYAFTDFEDPGAGIEFFYTLGLTGTASDPWPRNAEGVGVGSTQAEVLAAYPDAVVEEANDLGVGDLTRILVEDPDSDARYAFAFYPGSSTVDLLQWGINAGGQWSHLCGGF
jgi:hypothetical protein